MAKKPTASINISRRAPIRRATARRLVEAYLGSKGGADSGYNVDEHEIRLIDRIAKEMGRIAHDSYAEGMKDERREWKRRGRTDAGSTHTRVAPDRSAAEAGATALQVG